MTPNDTLLQVVIERLVKPFSVEKIILFGSQARGTAHKDSDLDLLVLCRHVEHRRALQVAMYRALEGLGIAKDIVIMTPDEFLEEQHIPGTVAGPAWREGRVLYERAA